MAWQLAPHAEQSCQLKLSFHLGLIRMWRRIDQFVVPTAHALKMMSIAKQICTAIEFADTHRTKLWFLFKSDRNTQQFDIIMDVCMENDQYLINPTHFQGLHMLFTIQCKWRMQLGVQYNFSSACHVLLCSGHVYEGISHPIKHSNSHQSLYMQ